MARIVSFPPNGACVPKRPGFLRANALRPGKIAPGLKINPPEGEIPPGSRERNDVQGVSVLLYHAAGAGASEAPPPGFPGAGASAAPVPPHQGHCPWTWYAMEGYPNRIAVYRTKRGEGRTAGKTLRVFHGHNENIKNGERESTRFLLRPFFCFPGCKASVRRHFAAVPVCRQSFLFHGV